MNKQAARLTKHSYNTRVGQQLDYWKRITQDVWIFNIFNTFNNLCSTPPWTTSIHWNFTQTTFCPIPSHNFFTFTLLSRDVHTIPEPIPLNGLLKYSEFSQSSKCFKHIGKMGKTIFMRRGTDYSLREFAISRSQITGGKRAEVVKTKRRKEEAGKSLCS